MSNQGGLTLCVLGCGNLGGAILESLLSNPTDDSQIHNFTRFIACVRSDKSQKALEKRFEKHSSNLRIIKGDIVSAVQDSDVVILSVDVADVESLLGQSDLAGALGQKILISVAAGWTRQRIETALYGSPTYVDNSSTRVQVVRALPNIAAVVSESLTAIEVAEPQLPEDTLALAESIFQKLGQAVRVPPRLMNAATAVGGSTPAFFAVICDALIDAAVAVGVPRDMAQTMIFQAMKGTAIMLQNGTHTGILKDQGTSPEGCTIAGLMCLEEAGVRGHVGRALREAVTVARLMESVEHVNDTRQA